MAVAARSTVPFAVVLSALVATLLAPSARAEQMVRPGTRVPLQRMAGGWAVKVEVGRHALRMLVDTGSTRSYIRREIAAALDLAPRARFEIVTPAGNVPGLCAGPIEIRLGAYPTSLDCVGWRATPAAEGDGLLPDSVDGLLGVDAFDRAAVLIDAGRGWLIIGGADLAPWIEGHEVPSGVSEGRFWIQLETASAPFAPGRRLRLVIDSGVEEALLFGAAARELGRSSTAPPGAARLTTLAGASTVRTVRLPVLAGPGSRLGRLTAVLLPGVEDRQEDGVVPLGRIGAVFIDGPGRRVLLDARLQATPRPPVERVAARGLTSMADQ